MPNDDVTKKHRNDTYADNLPATRGEDTSAIPAATVVPFRVVA